jgi:hypothetical protein
MSNAACTHLDQIAVRDPPASVEGCEDCLRTGGKWLHLRICLICGHVACCDDSPSRHATAHAQTEVVCDLFAQDIADLAALEFIAGLELSARAMGTHIVLRNIQDEMRSLIELAGLAVFDEAADRGARS